MTDWREWRDEPPEFELRPTPFDPMPDLMNRIVARLSETIIGHRSKALEKLLLSRIAGMRLRLVERRSTDGNTTTWTFEEN